ncbi:hypothetical protein VPH35_089250 [Triticum aestivum]
MHAPLVHQHHQSNHQIPFFFLLFHQIFIFILHSPPLFALPLFLFPWSPAATMVSWDDLPTSSEDDSVTSKVSHVLSSTQLGLLPQFSTKKWAGLATDLPSFTCEHGSLCEKHVAFQLVDSGRRFLACAHKEVPKCTYVERIDPEWPGALKMSLSTIWSMHEEETKQRLTQNVLSAKENLKIMEEKTKMDNELRHFKLDFAKMVA